MERSFTRPSAERRRGALCWSAPSRVRQRSVDGEFWQLFPTLEVLKSFRKFSKTLPLPAWVPRFARLKWLLRKNPQMATRKNQKFPAQALVGPDPSRGSSRSLQGSRSSVLIPLGVADPCRGQEVICSDPHRGQEALMTRPSHWAKQNNLRKIFHLTLAKCFVTPGRVNLTPLPQGDVFKDHLPQGGWGPS